MKFLLDHPISQAGSPAELADPQAMIAVVQAAEAAGFDGIGFTDHPAPSRRWLDRGGHPTLDPLAALAFCAAVTTRIRLVTYLLVLPYRSPLTVAKAIATVDRLSAGRMSLAVGAGYLRSEFAAVGADFDDRGAVLDGALDVLDGVWAEPGAGDETDVVSLPAPVQLPRPPVWVGGNSAASRDRAARRCDGWAPMLVGAGLARTTRTAALDSPQALAAAVDDLRRRAADAGHDPASLDVVVSVPGLGRDGAPLAETVDRAAALAEAGATWLVLAPPTGPVTACVEAVAAYGAQLIPALRDA
jgi:probable F420-dependent oxidoreductase